MGVCEEEHLSLEDRLVCMEGGWRIEDLERPLPPGKTFSPKTRMGKLGVVGRVSYALLLPLRQGILGNWENALSSPCRRGRY